MNEPADPNELSPDEFYETYIRGAALDQLIDYAVTEDLADVGDVTSQASFDAEHVGSAQIRTRQAGRLAGSNLIQAVLHRFDPALQVSVHLYDGSAMESGEVIADVTGPMRSLLSSERTVLNFLGYLSGIATLSDEYVESVAGTDARIYDTRKTLPGWRMLSKYAVLCGGGHVHRFGLYDAIMFKDNHLAELQPSWCDQLPPKIDAARKAHPQLKFVELEVDTLDQLREAINIEGLDVILLDNFSVADLKQAVTLRDRKQAPAELEASGGVTLETVSHIASTGVDRISVGAMTHSASWLDIAMDIQERTSS